MRDLEVLVPPSFMLFRRACFWTCPKKHTHNLFEFLGKTGARVRRGGDVAGVGDMDGDGGWEFGWGWGWAWGWGW